MDEATHFNLVNEASTARLIYSRDRARIKQVPALFYQALLYQIRESIPGLVQGGSYTLEEICGPEFWQSLDRGEAILAGECMAHMVCHSNDLPELLITKAPRTRPLEYGLK